MRKKFFINPAFQSKFILFMLLITTISLCMTYLTFNLTFNEFHSMADSSGLANNHPFRELILYQQERVRYFFLLIGAIQVLLIIGLGFWMGNKIAGPIYRIVKNLNNPEFKGEFTTRKGDYFKELPEAINRFLK